MSKISRRRFTVKAATAGVLGLGGCASTLRQNPDGIQIDERTETETAAPLVNTIIYHDGDWIVEFENQGVEGRLNTMLFECEEGKFEHDMKIHTADFCSEVHRTTHFVDPEETVKIKRDFPVERQDGKEYVTGVYPGTIVRTLRCTNRGGTVTAQLYERPDYGSTKVAQVIDDDEYDVEEDELFTVEFESEEYPAIASQYLGIRVLSEDGRVLVE